MFWIFTVVEVYPSLVVVHFRLTTLWWYPSMIERMLPGYGFVFKSVPSVS